MEAKPETVKVTKGTETPRVQEAAKPETRRIVRFMETDIDGTAPLRKALMRLRGVGFIFSNAVCFVTNMDPRKRIGDISQEELKTLENTIRNPTFPVWMLNRRKDPETGKNRHILGNEMQLTLREDINNMRRIRSYRGIRHELGQPVRGQRTRSSFRTNKTLGVSKKKQEPAKAAPAAAKPAAPPAKKK